MGNIMELVYKGRVHYRRPEGHPDLEEWKDVVKRNPLYSIRVCTQRDLTTSCNKTVTEKE